MPTAKTAHRECSKKTVKVVFGYNLTTAMQDKYDDAAKFDGWTAFINRRGNLVHVMRCGQPYTIVRLAGIATRGKSERRVTSEVSRRLYEGIGDIGARIKAVTGFGGQ